MRAKVRMNTTNMICEFIFKLLIMETEHIFMHERETYQMGGEVPNQDLAKGRFLYSFQRL